MEVDGEKMNKTGEERWRKSPLPPSEKRRGKVDGAEGDKSDFLFTSG